MLRFLRGPILGCLLTVVIILNALFWCALFYPVVLLKLIPIDAWRRQIGHLAAWLAMSFMRTNMWFCNQATGIDWEILNEGPPLTKDESYLITCNHRSWVDILSVVQTFGPRIPFPRFFLKQNLIYVPLVGTAWWALDYPFMRRYSKEFLAKNPHLRGKDMETTREKCQKFKNNPTSIMSFMEGTRYNLEKHTKQNSPYKNLLLPRAGGTGLVLSSMGEQLNCLLNMTVIYPDNRLSVWEFLCGKLRQVVVDVQKTPIPMELRGGDYDNDPVYRKRVQEWLATLWEEKDRRFDELMARYAPANKAL